MRFFRVISASAVCVAIVMASSAQAALHFSQADLMSMTIQPVLTYGWTPSANTGAGLTTDDNYNYGSPIRTMTGLAGAVGNLDPLLAAAEGIPASLTGLGYSATAFYGLGAPELAALNAAILGGESVLEAMGWNDNDDDWIVGIWAVDNTWPFGGAGSGTLDGLYLADGTGGSLSIDFDSIGVPPNTLVAAGVFIALPSDPLRGTDTFHASFGVPEPTTVIVWSALGTIGFLAYRRRQLA